MLKVLDLFSGIGGFSLGLESTGHFETIAFCEKDQFCQKVLKKHWSNIPIIDDVRRINGEEIKADVVVGGFPCQSISIAGKQKGKDDDRFLFPEMLRVIKEVKPRWIIGENVQNLINISNGTILREIVEGLENEGFEVQCFSISASSQGAWHKRERIWIIASDSKIIRSRKSRNINQKERLEKSNSTQPNCSNETFTNSKCLGFSKGSKKSEKFKREETSNKFNNCNKGSQFRSTSYQMELSNTKSIRSQGYELQHNLENGQELTKQLCKTDTQKQQTWWQTQSELCGIPDGIQYGLDKDRANRIKALGNSIVPQIARELGKAIIAAENEE
jgi:DNA (cytosine-5)-methyltransferase 1